MKTGVFDVKMGIFDVKMDENGQKNNKKWKKK
jgi:hypothetical protein